MIEVIKGDITRIAADAIVNAANTSLLGGGGVDGAIHRAGGPEILAECRAIRNRQGGCNVGDAVITTAGRLPAKYVIHTVGPVWNGGGHDEEALLAKAYTSCLTLAVENEISTLAFPNISTGLYKFPKDLAAGIAVMSVRKFLEQPSTVRKAIFVCFDDENFRLYEQLISSN